MGYVAVYENQLFGLGADFSLFFVLYLFSLCGSGGDCLAVMLRSGLEGTWERSNNHLQSRPSIINNRGVMNSGAARGGQRREGEPALTVERLKHSFAQRARLCTAEAADAPPRRQLSTIRVNLWLRQRGRERRGAAATLLQAAQQLLYKQLVGARFLAFLFFFFAASCRDVPPASAESLWFNAKFLLAAASAGLCRWFWFCAAAFTAEEKNRKYLLFFFFFFADVIKYGDILEIALKLQQSFLFFLLVAMIDFAKG